MSSEDPREIERLVELALTHLDERGQGGLDEFLREHPIEAAAIRRRLSALRSTGLLVPPFAVAIPQRIGDFTLLERLGSGGMGVVYRARQESLGREVALKVVRPDQSMIGQAHERFRREVETVARLHHPGIVPVIAVGEEAGIPWFAMDCIAGCTLAELIARLKDRNPATLGGSDVAAAVVAETRTRFPVDAPESAADTWIFAGTWTEIAVRIVARVADALDHAHRRGVLHRDVKPSNVMLTPSGGVMLLDFGVAGRLGEEGAETLTKTGARLGTLAYMSPEQLRGATDAVNVRADVYSLSATLLELLTFRPPFDGATETIVRAIADGRRTSARTFNPSTTWEMETAIDKGMDVDAARRYASAADLRRDLEAILEHRPIEARRPAFALRVRRWSQRRPALATGLILGFLLIVGAPGVVAWREMKARSEIQSALDESEKERARAEANLDRALAAMDLVVDTTRADLNVTGMEVVRRRLLTSVLRYYDEIASQRPDDPSVLLDIAAARRVIASVTSFLGDEAAMEKAHATSLESARACVARIPDDPRARSTLSLALRRYGNDLSSRRRFEKSIAAYEEALTLLDGTTTVARAELVLDLAKSLDDVGRREPARLAANDAVRVTEELESAQPGLGSRRLHALALLLRAKQILAEGDPIGARANYDRSVALLEDVVAHDRTDRRSLGDLAEALSLRGHLAHKNHRQADALADARRVVGAFDELTKIAPLVRAHRVNLAGALSNLSGIAKVAGEGKEAQETLERSASILTELCAKDPGDLAARSNYSAVLNGLGNLALERGDAKGALVLVERAESELDAILAANPSHPAALENRISQRLSKARALLVLRRYEDAVKILDTVWRQRAPNADDSILTAGLYGRALQLASADADLEADERRDLTEAYRGKAVAEIERLEGLGFRDVARLRKNPMLDPIKDDPRVVEIYARMAEAPPSSRPTSGPSVAPNR